MKRKFLRHHYLTLLIFLVTGFSTNVANSEVCISQNNKLGVEGLVVGVTESSYWVILTDETAHQRPTIMTINGGFDEVDPHLLRILTVGRKITCGPKRKSRQIPYTSSTTITGKVGEYATVAGACCLFDVGPADGRDDSEFMNFYEMIRIINR